MVGFALFFHVPFLPRVLLSDKSIMYRPFDKPSDSFNSDLQWIKNISSTFKLL